MLLVLHNVTIASLRTFARKVAADDETWRNNNQTWARANFSFFIYFLFQIKWHFEFFFTEKWGVDIHPIHPPCIRPCRVFVLWTIPRSYRVSTSENCWKCVLLRSVNRMDPNQPRLKRLIPIELAQPLSVISHPPPNFGSLQKAMCCRLKNSQPGPITSN